MGAIPAVKRQRLFMCIPVFRCEFSGTETVGEFKHMIVHTVPAFEWGRAAHPKLSVYFDECQHSFADTLKALSRFCGMDSGHPAR